MCKRVRVAAIVLACIAALLSGPAESPAQESGDSPPLSELMTQAEDLRNQLKWDEAIAKLREVVGRSDEDRAIAARAQVRIGKFLLDQGKLDEAEAALSQVTQLFSDQPEGQGWALLRQIDILQCRGDIVATETAAETLSEDTSVPVKFRVWARVKVSEVLISRGLQYDAIPLLEPIIAEYKDEFPEPVNWARVQLLQILTDKIRLSEAIQLGDEVVAEHAAGRASNEQAAFALLWKSRVLERSHEFDEAIPPAQMALALAAGKYPYLAYEAEYHLGQIYRRKGTGLKTGWGALYIEAMNHYGAALSIAESAGLSEDKKDHARLQYAGKMRDLGMLEKSIAWLRQGIDDPANLSPTDFSLSRRISDYMYHLPDQSEAWRTFLTCPASEDDPTAVFVRSVFGKEPSAASTVTANAVGTHLYWLGKLYEKQHRFGDALIVYDQALSAAATPQERAEALTAMAFCQNLTQQTVALSTAHDAADQWALVAVGPSEKDAHYAIEKIDATYSNIGRRGASLDLLRRIETELPVHQYPRRAAFLKYRLMRICKSQGMAEEAKTLGEEILDLFLDSSFGRGYEWLCGYTAVRLAYLYADEGNWEAAFSRLDGVAERWPQELGRYIEVHRSILAERNQ